MSSERDGPRDIEGNKSEQAFLLNDNVHSFSWEQLIVTVKDRETKKAKDLICDVNGSVGKGTLYFSLCNRVAIAAADTISWKLTSMANRRAHGAHGPIRLWQDNLA